MLTTMITVFLKNISFKQWMQIFFLVGATIMTINFYSNIREIVGTKLGMDTKTNLKEKTIIQKEIIKDLKEINKDLAIDINKKIESNKVDLEVINNNFKNGLIIDNNFEKIKENKIIRIDKIKEDYNTKPKTDENIKEKEIKISTEQITTLWETYCSNENNNIQCTNLNEVINIQ